MDYTVEASYSSFLISEMLQQIEMETAIREAVILAEGEDIYPKLDVLTESVFDKVKELWDKFVAFIKRIWAKFSETMMSTFDVDKPYLDKYRDIILKKPIQFTSVSMRNYQIDRIVKSVLEPFDYNMMKNDLSDRSKLTKRFINEFKEDESTEDLAGWCKAYFCGGSEETEELDPSKINISSMYDYCYTWKDKMSPALNKDITAINNSTTKAMNLIKNAEKPTTTTSSDSNDTETPAGSDNNDQKLKANRGPSAKGMTPNASSGQIKTMGPDSRTTNEEYYLELLGGDGIQRYSYLYEAEVKTGDSGSSTTTSTTKGTTVQKDQTAAAAVKSGNVDASKTSVEGGDDLEELKKCIDNYSYVASKIAASKLTVSEWAYKEYMQVIKAHVKQQLGNKETNPDQGVQQGQTYQNQAPKEGDKKPAEVPKA